MADSWEDHDTNETFVRQPASQQSKPTSLGLNPNAPSFSFNPKASSFTPTFTPGAILQRPPAPQTSGHAAAQPPAQSPASAAGHTQLPQTGPGPGSAQAGAVPEPPSERDPPAVSARQVQQDVDMQDAEDVDQAAQGMQQLNVNGQQQEQSPPQQQDKQPDKQPPAQKASPPQKEKGSPPDQKPVSAAATTSHDDSDEEETEEQRAKREKELQEIYAELAKEDSREHMNIVFIGHVDAGKSTIGGQILYLTGGVDERTIQKYEKEAKEKNRESWYMAYIMDTNEEERAKGKTVEVGRAHFETEKKRYTVLDAPGHKNYVPNMIGGAAQADVGVLVIAARKGEFETGFERGGQTREHAQLAKTLGVAKLIVAVNKMDDPSIAGPNGEWSKERYDEILEKLTPFLKSTGYNPKKDLVYLPVSGLLGHNIKDPVSKQLCPWYSGGTLFEILDNTQPLPRDPLAPFRMSIIDKYKDMGTIAMGKSEAGIVRKGDRLLVMPNKVPVTVTTIYRDDNEVNAAKGGENLRIRLAGIDEDDVSAGFVLCSRHHPVPAVTYFDAQIQLLELLEHKSIFTAGYKAVLHVHAVVEECEIIRLIALLDPKTKEKKKVKFVKGNTVCIARVQTEKPICIEKFENVPQLGRFTLRDEGRTIAIGKIVKLPKSLKE